ncbi:tetratricopeptide repeat protein [Chryseobacterium sp. MMS23-Vi53]|uniref:tetratricopeptide repeat protein n=1 Tax=Chryseobacterium sp. MMS23-Vi53 TaxID=3386644 RepID=UPI0039E9986B
MNPVDLELVKLKRQWQNVVKTNGKKPMFICLGEKHETDLFDGFIKSRLSEDYDGEDIFLVHYQEFNGMDSFGQTLFDEWKEYYDMLEKSEENIPQWEMNIADNQYKTDAYKAFFPLLELKKNFPNIKDSKIYLYIAPVRINEIKELSIWVKEWCEICEKSENQDIKLVWAEHHQYKTLPENSSAHSFRVEVDIHQLMQNTAAHTNRKKNSADTDFQQQILTASNHLSKGRFKEAEFSLKTAVKLAKDQKNKQGEISAYFMLTQTYIADKKKERAEDTYRTILEEVDSGSALAVQMYMNYGSYLLGNSKKGKAEKAFEKAAEVALEIGEYAMVIECYRIIGTINDSLISKDKMIQYFENCLDIAKLMEPSTRESSSLKFVASMLFNKYDGDNNKKTKLDNEMKIYFGEDWKVSVEQPKYS